MPTTDFVHRKSKKLEAYKTSSLKEEDVEKVRQIFQRYFLLTVVFLGCLYFLLPFNICAHTL